MACACLGSDGESLPSADRNGRLVRADRKQSLLDFRWCSVGAGYAMAPRKRPGWLAVAQGLASAGARDTSAGRRKFVERLDRRALSEAVENCGVPVLPSEYDARLSHLRRGWYWGSQAFAEKLLAIVADSLPKLKARSYRSSAARHAHGLDQAERLLAEGLAAASLTAEDIPHLKPNDPRRLALAFFLSRHTIVSQRWLAERLHLRSAANVSQRLRRLDYSALFSETATASQNFPRNAVPDVPDQETKSRFLHLTPMSPMSPPKSPPL